MSVHLTYFLKLLTVSDYNLESVFSFTASHAIHNYVSAGVEVCLPGVSDYNGGAWIATWHEETRRLESCQTDTDSHVGQTDRRRGHRRRHCIHNSAIEWPLTIMYTAYSCRRHCNSWRRQTTQCAKFVEDDSRDILVDSQTDTLITMLHPLLWPK